jgi:TatD DNase family protein
MIDSHCHLADDVFAPDVAEVVGRAVAAGVTGALCILDAGSLEERARAAALVRQWSNLRFAVGIHPHQAGAWTGRVDAIGAELQQAIGEQPAVRAIGEIGLDYHYDFAAPDVQREVFATQIQLAVARDLPIVVHAREADEDALAIVREAGEGRVRGVMHCFTGSDAFARRAVDLGFYISLAGIVTFTNAEALRDVARVMPGDRLLVETDSPFLAPAPHRGKRNEPAWVTLVGERLAAVRGMTPAELDELTTGNYETLFRATGASDRPKRLD